MYGFSKLHFTNLLTIIAVYQLFFYLNYPIIQYPPKL